MKNSVQIWVKVVLWVLAFGVALVLGISPLLTPPAVKGDADTFSAMRAQEHIKNIASVPHTVYDKTEQDKVRQYLLNTLASYGCATSKVEYKDAKDEDGKAWDITDIYGVLHGKGGEGSKSLLLVAHYDSNPGKGVGEAPGSTGAGDDAYGVSVILETLRALQSDTDRVNDIRVIFTDSEEVTMLGSKLAANDKALGLTDSEAVFNIESRGLRGPAVMFETSKNNANLIQFYHENSTLPASWSLATDVYRVMPNYTDFTAFTDVGMQGMNFSVLDSLEENHTPLDNYSRIDLSAIQGYGEQVLPMVKAFADGKLTADGKSPADAKGETFQSNSDMTYFTLVTGVLISYPSFWNYVVLGAALLAWALYLILAHRKKLVKPRRLWGMLMIMGFAILSAGVGYGISYLLSTAFNIPFKLTNMPGVPAAGIFAGASIALIGIALFFVFRTLLKKGWRYEELLLCTLGAMAIFTAGFTFALPGGAFLFGWPVLAGALMGMAALLLPTLFRVLAFVPAIWIFTPVIILLYISLTIGSLAVVLLLAAFPLCVAMPALAGAYKGGARKRRGR